MDYGKVLSRAWEITWRWKILWVLGFLAALGKGGGGGGGSSSYSTDSSDWGYTFQHGVPGEVWALIAGVTCLAILIGIAIWVISIMARGGLIAGVQQVEDEGSTTLGSAWRVGVSRFWTLFGLDVLVFIPTLLVLLIGGGATAALVIGGEAAFDEAGAIVPGILCGGGLCCGFILLVIVLNQIKVYADRAAILEGLGWIDAFKRGWEVLKANLGPTIIFWLIFLVLGLLIAIVVGGIMFVAAMPIVAIFANVEPGIWMVAPLCCGGLLAFIIFALISSVVETFTSATWTLAYREMTGLAPAAAAAEPVAVEE